jgi:hypothetical protein
VHRRALIAVGQRIGVRPFEDAALEAAAAVLDERVRGIRKSHALRFVPA